MTRKEKFEQIFGFKPDENKSIYCEPWWNEEYHSPIRHNGKGHKCGECEYFNRDKKHACGYECERPNWVFRTSCGFLKYPSTPACKEFKERENGK